MQALSPSPSDRPSSALEMGEILEGIETLKELSGYWREYSWVTMGVPASQLGMIANLIRSMGVQIVIDGDSIPSANSTMIPPG